MKSFYYTTDLKENASEERYKAKRSLDADKIQKMNQLIPSYNMNWVAGDNSIVASYYEQKRNMFGDGYNLSGFDYYSEGVFEFLGHSEYPKVNPDLVHFFDWRNRHGANDPSSHYWDGDTLGTGWLTSVKDQGNLGTCWAFSAAGLVEVISNLFANDTLDFDLSEQNIISCSGAGDCLDGGNAIEALIYVKYPGIVSELCFPYDPLDCDLDSCNNICAPPRDTVRITDTLSIYSSNQDSIRLAIIKYGPITSGFGPIPMYTDENHIVIFVGYEFDHEDSTVTWIMKNSWGVEDGWGINGFCKLKLSSFLSNQTAAIKTPIKLNNQNLPVNCWDKDLDGYYFWGIGEKPKNCPLCSDTEDCDDNDSLVGGYDENYNCRCNLVMDTIAHHVSADTNWSDTTYVNYEVIVDSGACLTISSYAAFAPQAYIVVLPGAELNIDGGYLTKACPDLWGGIEVWGSDTVQYFDEFFGKVVMTNNAVIEFAKTGIVNHCTRCVSNQMQSGGIILANSSIFRDNETDVLLAPFKNMWLGREYPYVGNFIKCQFITTDNLYPEFKPKVHVEIKDIFGITIAGCVFKNESDMALNPYSYRGTGISEIDAQFTIKTYCNNPNIIPCNDFDSCKFIGLEYGIKALNSTSIKTLNIQDVVFESNLLAISLSGIDNASLLSNQIKCSESINGISPDRFIGGIFLEGCHGYLIENNYVHDIIDTLIFGRTKKYYGIGVKNSGRDFNKIYNNRLGSLKVGIYALGENRSSKSGLCLTCNDMVDNLNDFVVDSIVNHPLGAQQGIYNYQGDPQDSLSYSAPAGNVFSYFDSQADYNTLTRFNYYNNAEDILYTHHYSQDFRVRPLDSNYTQATIELNGWQDLDYDKVSACPSSLGGGGLKTYSDPRLAIHEADNHVSLLTDQLNSLIDGGNTEQLNFEVITCLPGEGLEIRHELLGVSPYLSDTILKQAIYKEDVLPNAMIRDILVANPQSAKSDEILNTLESRFEPMPEYMMAEIMLGKKYLGAKEVLEAKIQSWQQIRSKAKAELLREFLLDTNIVRPLDSVIVFLENETDLESRYSLALAHWDNSDPSGAWGTLNTIPSQFTLRDIQNVYHENYLEYFGILQSLADSSWQADQLDSFSVTLLDDLKESGSPGIAALARGLLVKGGFFKYIETINLPELAKSSAIHHDPYKALTSNSKEEKLWLFPNPAGDYVTAFYNLDVEYKSGEIQLVDLKGNLLRSYRIECGKNQLVIDLKAYPNGLYMISLNSRNKVIDSKKLSKGGQ